MTVNEGGCICGAVRFCTTTSPLRVTVCHCRFCQRATGSAYMVEPVFSSDDVRVTRGALSIYEHISEGSGKKVHVHFCAHCGTKIYLTFERFPGSCGVYAGTFDEPNWFSIDPRISKHIFIDAARDDTILPPGLPVFREHAMDRSGAPLPPLSFAEPCTIERARTR